MATLIPSLNSCIGRMQAGEKRFAWRLGTHLEDDYLCWYELPVGKRQRYSDFIILHPARGLLLVEVKDWKLDSIKQINKVSTTLQTNAGIKIKSNPIEQVRQCTYQLVKHLETDPQLIQQSGNYKGNFSCPYGYGVVFTNITRKQFNATDLGEVLPEHQVICKDEMLESVDPEAFQEQLWNMFNVQFSSPLTLPQIDRIRWHLFPEIRIGSSTQCSLFSEEPEEQSIDQLFPDIIKVMDMQQEILARSLGEGHRVIHGVAGSGKTLILGYRCLYLAKLLHKPILVLCYNITLAARLRELINSHGISDKVSVYHFHDWCGEQLRTYHIDRPPQGNDYIDALVNTVIDAAKKGTIPRAQYGAIMIDEGHDFKPEWLQLVVSMVDETDSLLLLYDDAQSIYNHKKKLDFSLSSVGIQARGRTTVLKLNYRNTQEILHFAYNFACKYLNTNQKGDNHVPLVEPEPAGRHGVPPAIRVFTSYDQEGSYIAKVFHHLHNEQQHTWGEMCIIYRSNWMGKQLFQLLSALNIPCELLSSSVSKKRFTSASNTVKLMTMHSSKGLEFPVVAISGVGFLPLKSEDQTSAAKLLYVAMTRATDKLLLTSHKENSFLSQLRENPVELS